MAIAIAPILPLVPLAAAGPVISEFMASNATTLADADGEFSDWIELHNPDAAPVSLAGYHLTDDAAELNKWTFPAVTLPPGGYLVVFASDKNRTDPADELHTSFRLGAGGEYLALVAPDGTTVVSEFAPVYPPQFEDESFGPGAPDKEGQVDLTPVWDFPNNYANVWLSGTQQATLNGGSDNIDSGTGAPFTQFYMWFDLSARLASIAPGSTVDAATMEWSGAVNPSIFGNTAIDSELGIFPVPDANKGIDTIAASFSGSGSEMADYYAAHDAVSAYTAAPGQTPVTVWDITALVQDWVDNPDAPQRGQFMILNDQRPMHMEWDVDATNKPVLTATATTSGGIAAPPANVYFDMPTPGAANSGGQLAGPIFGDVTENPPQPVSGAQVVTAEIAGSSQPVSAVTVHYRLGFGGEVSAPMADDGTGVDATAGDGIYSAAIPATHIAPGEMTRWRYVARDALGVETREPAFRDPLDSHQYFGTVGHDPGIESNLSVVHWFVQDPGAAGNLSGTRGALYYLGEFYDNIYFNRHGQSTGSFIKKSYNIDFNKTQRFRWSPDAPRVVDINLLTNWADKSKVRHVLAYEIMRESGVAAHFAYTVRVEQNGEFFSTADFVEDGDDEYLERAGLNDDGALYKVYSNRLNKDGGDDADSGVEKKNRRDEDNADLQALIDGLDLNGAALDAFIRDNVDIPKCVNLLAANSVIRNIDMHSKNWYIYRDTGKTDEWAILPWDLDLSAGRVWNSTDRYFDNRIYTGGLVVTGTAIRLVSQLFGNAETRPMIMRRIRTLADQFLQEPETPLEERWYERRLDEQLALIDPPGIVPSDAQRDFEKWGSWLQGNGNPVPYTNPDPDVESMAEAVARFKDEYLVGRRDEIYNNQTVGNGGEIPQPQTDPQTILSTPLLVSGADAESFVPGDGSLGLTWTGGDEPFDASGWTAGPTGIGYERGNGYQSLIATDVGAAMASNASIYIRVPFEVDDAAAFDHLELRMIWDDGFVAYLNGTPIANDNAALPVTWNSTSNGNGPEASPGNFNVYDVTAGLPSLRSGENVLAIHGLNQSIGSSDFIIVPELYGGETLASEPGQPRLAFGEVEFSPASGNQDEEYFELLNPYDIAVDISDWQVAGAVRFTFQPGTVIPPNGTLYVSPDINDFRARATSPTGGEGLFVQGGYSGHLSSFGETLTLIDSDGAVNATKTYLGAPSAAQLSLVVSEIMYHPVDADGAAEFVEIMNISATETLDLTGVRFTGGIDFDFTGSAVTALAPGERALVVQDATAFAARHGAGLPVAGIFAETSRLNNGGETLKLEDASNETIKEFTYNDKAPWPETAAGTGPSLVLVAPERNPDPDIATNWRASTLPGGNPGGTDASPFPADPLGDTDANGITDLIDYAMGNHLGDGPIAATLAVEPYDIGGVTKALPTLRYPINLGADRATSGVELSTDMAAWQDAGAAMEVVGIDDLGDGRAMVTARISGPMADGETIFVRVRVATNE